MMRRLNLKYILHEVRLLVQSLGNCICLIAPILDNGEIYYKLNSFYLFIFSQ